MNMQGEEQSFRWLTSERRNLRLWQIRHDLLVLLMLPSSVLMYPSSKTANALFMKLSTTLEDVCYY